MIYSEDDIKKAILQALETAEELAGKRLSETPGSFYALVLHRAKEKADRARRTL